MAAAATSSSMLEFPLADIGEGIAEVEVLEWHVSAGSKVRQFEPVCTVQSDKASVEITSRYDGVVTKVHYSVGSMVPVGSTLLSIAPEGSESASEASAGRGAGAPLGAREEKKDGLKVFATPAVRRLVKETGLDYAQIEATGPQGRILKGDVIGAAARLGKPVCFDGLSRLPPTAGASSSSWSSSPEDIPAAAATMMMSRTSATLSSSSSSSKKSTDVDVVSESIAWAEAEAVANGFHLVAPPPPPEAEPPSTRLRLAPRHNKNNNNNNNNNNNKSDDEAGGRILMMPTTTTTTSRGEEERAAEEGAPSSVLVASEEEAPPTPVRLRGVRAAMYKTMAASLAIPHFVYCDEYRMERLVEAQEALGCKGLPLILKAVSVALRDSPAVNASVISGGTADGAVFLQHHKHHHLGVAMDTAAGLVVPVVRDVDRKSVADIAADLAHLRDLANQERLALEYVRGATLTLSNIGSLGGTYMAPVVVPPQVAIGAIGRTRRVPAFASATSMDVVAALVAPVSWAADHRVVDGATMARFSNRVKDLLQNPIHLLSQLH